MHFSLRRSCESYANITKEGAELIGYEKEGYIPYSCISADDGRG
jgi:hypothetical protein